MCIHNVDWLEGCTTNFRVEVHTAAADSAFVQQDFVHSHRRGVQVRWELICIPAKQQVALVRIDGAKNAVDTRYAKLVFERVTSKRCMVRFKVQFEVRKQVVFLQE
ncbi:hypothetical protein D3C85_1440060 [compost metagenome]